MQGASGARGASHLVKLPQPHFCNREWTRLIINFNNNICSTNPTWQFLNQYSCSKKFCFINAAEQRSISWEVFVLKQKLKFRINQFESGQIRNECHEPLVPARNIRPNGTNTISKKGFCGTNTISKKGFCGRNSET